MLYFTFDLPIAMLCVARMFTFVLNMGFSLLLSDLFPGLSTFRDGLFCSSASADKHKKGEEMKELYAFLDWTVDALLLCIF